ncbi:MAG: hypothetical protein GY708_17845, partial [Actinomycetia bacterium]|nr:hypothetical protein [Actinomycetes bacterium]
METFEGLLAAAPSLTTHTGAADVTFAGSGSSNTVELQTSGGQLQWRDGSTGSFSSDFNASEAGDQTVIVSGAGAVTSVEVTATDPEITGIVLGDITAPGVDLTFEGLAISVIDSTIDTTNSSGSAGLIRLEVDRTNVGVAHGFASLGALTESLITLTRANLLGGAVQLAADATQDASSPTDAGINLAHLIPDLPLDMFLIAGVDMPSADAIITVSGGSIVADTVNMEANATTDVAMNVASVFLGAGVAISSPTAKVDLTNGASIQTTGDVTLKSNAKSDVLMNVAQYGYGQVAAKSDVVSLSFAYAETDLESKTSLSSDSSITSSGGAVTFDADGDKVMNISTTAFAGNGGVLGTAMTLSYSDADVSALIDGTVIAAGDVVADADFVSGKNDASSSSANGTSAGRKTQAKNWVSNGFAGGGGTLFQIAKGGDTSKADTTRKSTNRKIGVSAAITYMDHDNTVIARVGPSANVTSMGGDVKITAKSSDLPELRASSSVSSSASGESKSTKDNSLSAGVSVAELTNSATAYIADGGTVLATTGDLLVQSQAIVPWEQQWWHWEGLRSISDKINANLGIQNGLFTTWAEATVSGKKSAFGGSVNAMTIENNSDAYIGSGASVVVAGETIVIAETESDTLNFAGQFGLSLVWLSGTSSGGTGVGGSVNRIHYINNTTAEILSGAAVNTGSLLTMARTDERNISITIQGGKADSFAFNGALGWLEVDNQTTATISDGAAITVGSGQVSVPRDFDTFDGTLGESMFTNLPKFTPTEVYEVDSGGTSLLRVDEG